ARRKSDRYDSGSRRRMRSARRGGILNTVSSRRRYPPLVETRTSAVASVHGLGPSAVKRSLSQPATPGQTFVARPAENRRIYGGAPRAERPPTVTPLTFGTGYRPS